METTLALETPIGNSKRVHTATCQGQNMWIVRGPHRYPMTCWSEVHALVLQGWFCIRRGNEILTHWADVEEGEA